MIKLTTKPFLQLAGRIIICLAIAFSFAGCDDEEAPLQFKLIANTAPGITHLDYYNPDLGPFGGVKEYFLRTNFTESQAKLQCTNCKNIRIETSFTRPFVPETGGSTSTVSTAEETGMHISLDEGGVIVIDFTELSLEDSCYAYYAVIKAYGSVDGKEQVTTINLTRSRIRSTQY